MEAADGGAPGGEKVAEVLDQATPDAPPGTEALLPIVGLGVGLVVVVVIPRAGVSAAKLPRSDVIVRKAGACAFAKVPAAAAAVPGIRDEVVVGACFGVDQEKTGGMLPESVAAPSRTALADDPPPPDTNRSKSSSAAPFAAWTPLAPFAAPKERKSSLPRPGRELLLLFDDSSCSF